MSRNPTLLFKLNYSDLTAAAEQRHRPLWTPTKARPPSKTSALTSALGLWPSRRLNSTQTGVTSDLLDHLGVLLHDVQEAVVRRHGRGPLLRGPRQLLEQVGDDVVQTGAAARAHHRVWKGERTQKKIKYFFRRLKGAKPPFHNLQGFFPFAFTECSQAFRYRRQDVHDDVRLQAGDEVHVVLRQHLQERVERLAEFGIVLHGEDGTDENKSRAMEFCGPAVMIK